MAKSSENEQNLTHLALVSSFVEENWMGAAKNIEIMVTERKRGDLTLITSEGVILNEFLPQQYRIRYSESDFYVEGNIIYIPKNFHSLGLTGKISIAHELGHAMHEDIEASRSHYRKAYKEADLYKSSEIVPKITALLEAFNTRLEMEVVAWQNGLPISDVLGVDQLYYENLMEYALDSYLMFYLTKIAMEVDLLGPLPENHQIALYDPRMQDYLSMDLYELRQVIANFHSRNKITEAETNYSRAADALSKIK